MALSVTGCTPAGKSEPGIARVSTDSGGEVKVSFPGHPELLPTVEKRKAENAKVAGFSEAVEVHDQVELGLPNGNFPESGAVVSFEREQGLPEGVLGTVAYFDEADKVWVPVKTELSPDRKTLTAHVDHFSLWGFLETVIHGVGLLTGTFTEKPTCDGTVPEWADMTFFDNKLDVLQWCVGGTGDPEELVVKATMNRNYPAMVYSAARTVGPPERTSDPAGGVDWQGFVTNEMKWTEKELRGPDVFSMQSSVILPFETVTFRYAKKDLMRAWGDIGSHGGQLLTVGSHWMLGAAASVYNLIEIGAASYGGDKESLQWLAVLLKINDCAATSSDKDPSSKTDLVALANCLTFGLDIDDQIGKYLTRKATTEASLAVLNAAVKRAFIAIAVAEGTLNTIVFSFDFGDKAVRPQMTFGPTDGYLREFVVGPWTTTVTDDRAMEFEHHPEWTVHPLESQANDPTTPAGVSLEIRNSDGVVMGTLYTGVIFGAPVMPETNPYVLLERLPTPGLESKQTARGSNNYAFQAVQDVKGWGATMGITNYPEEQQDLVSMAKTGFSFTERSGGFFNRFIAPDLALPGVDATSTGQARLTAYMGTDEYKDIRRMIMSLHFVAQN
ncbi:hypothetical protein [Arthrobacter sp. PAMC 25486]|uniref:hypothetical protein n=1 Tax=Arthrobacter sp. PAMC 25486 TaxID=1494608 RepID=UPI00138E1094|nr:hypothetical protein [Arthrobacter sp. PAMC 25486]